MNPVRNFQNRHFYNNITLREKQRKISNGVNQAAEHFNNIARDYDYYKKKNWYYYAHLKNLYQEFIPPESRVLDIGCGTGDILVSLKPKYGLGIDISPEMIKVAQLKYEDKKNIEFLPGRIEELIDYLSSQNFDYIFLADVVEHLENVPKTIKTIGQFTKPHTQLIISMANPLWEPILLILEKLKLKIAEGPHRRISLKELELILAKNNFRILDKGYRLVLPAFLPFLSDFLNKSFYQIPFLKNLGLVIFLKCSKIV